MNRLFTTVAFAAVALTAAPALATPVDEVCMTGGRPQAQCECATDGLAALMGEEDFAIYDEASAVFLSIRSTGASDEEAWDAAVIDVAARLGVEERMVRNRVQMAGNMHRETIRGCR